MFNPQKTIETVPIMYESYQEKREKSPDKGKWYACAKNIGTKDLEEIQEDAAAEEENVTRFLYRQRA